ncbi:FecR family protein [bacterium A37T11]|nr:FecR family protein [bacterium A37T11]
MRFNEFQAEDFVCDQSFQEYCLGTNSHSVIFWENWISSHPQKQIDIEEATRLFALLSVNQGNIKEQLWQLKKGLDNSDAFRVQVSSRKQPKPRRWLPAFLKISVPLAAASIFLLAYQRRWFSAASSSKNSEINYYHTGEGKQTLVLDDGSLVTLQKHSSLTLHDHFSSTNRTVFLKGQAYFNVSPNKNLPFVVQTNLTRITVLSTSFSVREDLEKGISETILISGKVVVNSNRHPEDPVTILPHQKFVYQRFRDNGLPKPSIGNRPPDEVGIQKLEKGNSEISWIRKKIDISNQNLEQIAAILQKWYGITILFDDKEVKSYRYTGVFQHENILSILKTLQMSYPFHFRVADNKIYISK